MKDKPEIVKEMRLLENKGLFSDSSVNDLEELRENVEEYDENKSFKFQDDQNDLDFSEYTKNSDLDEYSESNEKEILFQTNKNLLLYLSKTGKIIKINKTALELSGFSEKEVLGKFFWKIPGVFSKKNIPKYLKIYKDALKGNVTERFVCDLKGKSGKKLVMEFSAIPIKKNNSVSKILVVGKDLTEQKKHESHYKHIFNSAPNGFIKIDNKGFFTDINKRLGEMLGLKSEDFIGKNVFTLTEIFPKKTIKLMKENFEKRIKGETVKPYVISVNRSDGKKLFVEVSGNLIYEDDEVVGEIVILRDITESLEKEKKLKEARKRYQEIFQGSRDGFVMVDTEGGIIDANPSFCEMLGYSLDELKNMKDFYKFTPEKWRKWEQEEIWDKRLMHDGYSGVYEKEYIRKDGSVFPVELQLYAVKDENDEILYLWGIARDITDKKTAEESYKTIFNSSTDAIFVHDLKDGRIVDVNNKVVEIFGYSRDEIKKLNVGDLSVDEPPYTAKEAQEWIQKAINEGPQHFEWLSKTKDGKLIWHENILRKVRISGEERIIVNARDITDRKKAEKDILESERKYRNVVENANDGIAVAQEGVLKFVNPKVEKILGYSKDELVSKPFIEFIHPNDRKMVYDNYFKRLKDENVPKSYEFRVVTRDEEVRWVRISANRITWDNKIATLNFLIDITEKKNLSRKAEESEKLFQTLVEQSSVGVYIHDPVENKVLYANPLVREVLGFSEDEFDEVDFYSFVHPDDLKLLKERTKRRLSGEDIDPSAEIRLYPPNEDMRWARIYTSFIDYEGKKVALATVVDITKSKEAEEELKKSKEKYKSIFNNAQVGIFRTDIETGKLLEANNTLVKFTGYESKEKLFADNYNIAEHYVNPSDREKMLNVLKKNGKISGYDAPFKRIDGSVMWIRFSARVSENKKWIEGVSEDITDWKKAEEKLKENEAKYRSLFEGINEAAYKMSLPDGRYEYFNPAAEKVFGYPRDKFLNNPVLIKEIIHPDFKDFFIEKWNDLKNGIVDKTYEYKIIDPKGEERWIIQSNHGIFDKNGKIVAIEGICRDDTERKKAEIKMKESKERYRSLFEDSQEWVYVCDFKGNFLDANQAALKGLGYTKDEIKNLKFSDLINKKQLIKAYKSVKEIKKTFKQEEPVEYKIQKKNGNYVYVESMGSVLMKDGEPFAVQGIAREITERKKAEEAIRASQKETERILNAAADGIRIVGKDFKIKKLNQTMADMAGVDKEKAVGMNCSEIFKNKTICGTKNCSLMQVLENKKQITRETTHINKKGKKIPCLDVITPWYNTEGELAGVIEDYRDLSELKKVHKKLEESEDLFKTLVEKTSTGVYIYDPINKKMLYTNPMIKKTLGIKEDDFSEIDLFKFVQPEDAKKIKKRIRDRIAGKNVSDTINVRVFTDNQKEPRWIQLYTSLIQYDGKPALIASVIDFTERKKAQEQLQEKLDELQRYKNVTIGREMRVVELKKEINDLLKQQGKPLKYIDTQKKIEQKESKDREDTI